MAKIDLTLITELVAQLAKQADLAEKMTLIKTEGVNTAYTVELSKALGLVTGIKMEADLLTADLTRLIKSSTFPPTTKAEEDMLSQIFGGVKPIKMS